MALPLSACGGGDSDPPRTLVDRPALQLVLDGPTDGSTTLKEHLRVLGRVTARSKVRVNGRRAEIQPAGTGMDRFAARVRLERGRNEIEVTASRPGFRSVRQTIVVRRTRASEGSDANSPQGGVSGGGDSDGSDPESPQGGSVGSPAPDDSGPESPQGAPPAAQPAPESPQGGPPGAAPDDGS